MARKLAVSCWYFAFALSVFVLCGCGGGSTGSGSGNGSGGGGGSNPPPAADFALTLSTATVSAAPGGITGPATISVTAENGFSDAVSVTASLPPGLTCGSTICTGELDPGGSIVTQFIAGGTVTAGTYTVTFTGTSDSLTHSATLTVKLATPTPVPNQSGMVYTGDFLPPGDGVIYDKAHDRIYLSNFQLSEVDVISPESLQIVKRIPVPGPVGLDLSPDSSTLYAGTATTNFFEIDTTSLSVSARVPFPGNRELGAIFPEQVVALSDGTLAIIAGCGYINPCTTYSEFFIFSPSTGKAVAPEFNGLSWGGSLKPSADRSRVFMEYNGLDGGSVGLLQYDTASKTLTNLAIAGAQYSAGLAVRPDGAGYAFFTGDRIIFLDAQFNEQGSYSINDTFNGMIYSADSTRLYLPDTEPYVPPVINVIDAATFQLKGQIPSEDSPAFSFTFSGVDGQNRLLGLDADLLVLIDANLQPGSLPATFPTAAIGGEATPLQPDNSSAGYATTFNGDNFGAAPQITFNRAAATGVTLSSSSQISLTAPASTGAAQADVNVYFPNGYFLLAPDAYSYAPTILFTDGDAGATAGGSTLTLYGFGLNFPSGEATASVGANQSSSVVPHGGFLSPYPVPLEYETVTVPAGTKGRADITTKNPLGTATIAGGFSYAERTDSPGSPNAAVFQMVLDKAHERLLWTDPSFRVLNAYSLASQSLQQISVNGVPGGLGLTPDGSKLLVVIQGGGIDVYDSASFELLQHGSIPAQSVLVAPVSGGKAFVLSTISGYGDVPVYEYDITSNSATQRTDVTADQSSDEAASSDGSAAFVAGSVWNAATDSFVPALTSDSDYSRALSADGAVLSEFCAVFGPDGNLNGIAGIPWPLQTELEINSVPGQTINATGSLAYLPETDRIRVIDVRHGKLVRTIMVPDGLDPEAYKGLVADPDGQTLYVMTQTGLTTFTFASDPLSIGEVQISGNNLTILGSGFVDGETVLLDGTSISSSLQDSQHISATVASLSAGAHNITILLPSGQSYSLDNAMDIAPVPSGATSSPARLRLSNKRSPAAPPWQPRYDFRRYLPESREMAVR